MLEYFNINNVSVKAIKLIIIVLKNPSIMRILYLGDIIIKKNFLSDKILQYQNTVNQKT